jgi:CelD/BcsL family acetyltransferase involved in cellulose biosynthesis
MGAVPSWREIDYELPYRMGEVTLFRRGFTALALDNHFLELPQDPGEPRPPFERLYNDCEVIICPSHPVDRRLPRVTRIDRALRYVPSQYTHYYTALSGTFEAYLSKFSAKTRSTLRRKIKRFLELGEGCYMREYKRAEEMGEFYRLARQVSERTYQEKLFDGGLPVNSQFRADLVRRAEVDAVRAYLLFLRNEPIAYLCCPAANRILIYSYTGHDSRHAHLSPGTVLQLLAFKSLFHEQAFTAFDFTQGQGAQKKFFGTHELSCADLLYFPCTSSSRCWIALHVALDQASTAIGRSLQRFGLKTKVKKLVRRMAAHA